MKSFAVTILVDGEDEQTVRTNVEKHLRDAVALRNVEINDIEEIGD